MIRESVDYQEQVGWFTTLVSKSVHVHPLQSEIERTNAAEVRIVPMEQGQKISRFLAWRFV
jgi:23S rRNA (adenine1618-N6)-methyltransferase